MRSLLASVVVFACISTGGAAESLSPRVVEKGTVQFDPLGKQTEIPERYRLDSHRFDYEMTVKHEMPTINVTVYTVRFPSPVKTPHEENNTVYAEYYAPHGKGPFPGVIVLDITGGDQSLSRSMATHFAMHNVGALFVQMAYYGPRRPPGSNLRLLSRDIPHTMEAIRQTVLDLRRATAWLASRPELDAKRLGIVGTSLGSMIGALTAEMEPRLGRVAVLLGGGGLVDGFYDHPQAKPYISLFEKVGGNREMVRKLLAPVDPLTCAQNLRSHKVLIIGGKRDEIIAPRMTTALWKASGEQKLIWYDCTHYGAIVYLVPAMKHIVEHFTAP